MPGPGPSVLAHGGGFSWDETLFLLAPIVIFAFLLAAAKRKTASDEREAANDAEPNDAEGPEGRPL